MRNALGLGLILSLLAAPALAQTPDCPPLKQLAAIKLERTAPDGPFLVPVRINGVTKNMLLATAFPVSRMYPNAMADMKLPVAKKSLKMGGSTYGTTDQAHVDTLVVGNVQFTNSDFPIFNGIPPWNMVGILGMDVLGHFDVDLDLANGMLNLFDAGHCDGQVVYWKTDSTAVLPIKYDMLGRIIMPVKLDGKSFTGLIDTVMPDSTMYLPALKKTLNFQVSDADVTVISTGGKLLRHKFDSLELPGVAVANPLVAIWDDTDYRARSLTGPAPVTVLAISGSGVVDQLALGFKTLSKLHVYIAMKEKKLYISPASAGQQGAQP